MPKDALFERHNESFVAHYEKIALQFIAARLPRWIMPDHLTAFGVLGAVVVLAGYVAAHASPLWLWLANLGLLMHWLGDSLDGTVARFRKIERPRYGYFLDQTVDVTTNLLIALGIGLSPWVRLDSALFTLAGYHMLSIHTFVRNVVTSHFHIDIHGLGPTEMRLGILGLNLLILAIGAKQMSLWSIEFTWCDVVTVLAGAALMVLFHVEIYKEARRLLVVEHEAAAQDPSE